MKVLRFAFALVIVLTAASIHAAVNSWSSIGPEGGIAYRIQFDPTDSTTVYAAANGGIFGSNDGGQNWNLLLPGSSRDIKVTSDGSRLFAAMSYGIRTSIDAGITWTTPTTGFNFVNSTSIQELDLVASTLFIRGSGRTLYYSTDLGATISELPSFNLATTINAIMIDPGDTSRLYLGTNSGVYISTNGGQGWTPATMAAGYEDVKDIVRDPNNVSVFYVATSAGVAKSTDSGGSWAASSTDTNLSLVAVDPKNSNIIYAARNFGATYRTDNGGGTWATVNATAAISIAVHPLTADRLLLSAPGNVFVSTDAAVTWTSSSAGLNSTDTEFVAVHPTTGTVYAGGVFGQGLSASDMSGNLMPVAGGLNASPVKAVAFDFANPNILYAGGQGTGGFYKSTDGGTSWVTRVTGLSNLTTYAVAVSPLDANFVLRGSPDFGASDNIARSINAALSWTEVNGTVASDTQINEVAIDPTNDSVIYVATQVSGIGKSTDRGLTWATSNGSLPTNTLFNGNPVHSFDVVRINPHDNNDIWAFFGDRVYRSPDAGVTWSEQSFSGVSGESIAFHPTDSATFYIGKFRTSDGGSTWCDIQTGLESFRFVVEHVAIDNSNPNKIYVSTTNNGIFAIELAPQAPTADAGSDAAITVAQGVTVALSAGGSSDAGGCIASYSWTQLSGPAAATGPSNLMTTGFIPAASGTHVFEVTVVDNDGSSSTDQVTLDVTVSAATVVDSGGGGGGGGGAMPVTALLFGLVLIALRRVKVRVNLIGPELS